MDLSLLVSAFAVVGKATDIFGEWSLPHFSLTGIIIHIKIYHMKLFVYTLNHLSAYKFYIYAYLTENYSWHCIDFSVTGQYNVNCSNTT